MFIPVSQTPDNKSKPLFTTSSRKLGSPLEISFSGIRTVVSDVFKVNLPIRN